MAGYENIKGKGFDSRTTEELRVITSNGGKASGEARRRKADFRKALNLLLTAEIDSPEWSPMLESLGLDSTLESAINAAMIKEALAGDVKAYTAIRDTLGQTTKSEVDLEEQQIKIDNEKMKTKKSTAIDDSMKEMERYFEQRKETDS
ncbi:MAG: hypothetical protein H2212_07245 [Ruminococcus sp.]|nr:hypothetical protein [Ruminococcus sp.]